MTHPRDVLVGATAVAALPVCDHYCGVESRMVKSLQLQAQWSRRSAACLFDVTLDCEDGAPVGSEQVHAQRVCDLAAHTWEAASREAGPVLPRIAVRVHPVDHPAFASDVQIILGGAAPALCHVMLPKVESRHDVDHAVAAIDRAAAASGRETPVPVQVLIESPQALQQVADIVSHPRVQSASFGLMDFVSAHAGCIPASAMGMAAPGQTDELDQFHHPLVVRAKLEISAACHAYGKVASHCVVTEFKDASRVRTAARQASQAFGYARMWSIHPDQIQPILEAFAPPEAQVQQASAVICAGHAVQWAPVSVQGQLHDRASYRYFWQVLERAHQTAKLPAHDPAQVFFSKAQ